MSWLPDTPTKSENDPSNYGTIRSLREVLVKINVQHLQCATIYSQLLSNSPTSIGQIEIMGELAVIFASFVKLRSQLEDCITHAIAAKTS
jgi:hypothetical protein